MSARFLPVRPDLDQLKHQAKDLLRGLKQDDPSAIAEFRQFHPSPPELANTKLADAQLALARAYQAPSWPRLVQACKLIDAIWEDDLDTVRDLVDSNPQLLHEYAGIRNANWGPPLSYAANLGRDRIITMLHERGAIDLRHGFDRAVLQSRIGTARMLHKLLGEPKPPVESFGTPAYSLSVSGTALLFELGGELVNADGRPWAPLDMVLETDGRDADRRHQILDMYESHGFELPDTATFAVFRGRIDLLKKHFDLDPSLSSRTFGYEEIFPPALGCHNEDIPRTTLVGATLLYVCIEFDELEVARWLLDRGMSPDAPAGYDALRFGGHTPLFNAVVSFPNFWRNYGGRSAHDAPFARLLLDHGANPNARADMRERVFDDDARSFREHRGLTPLSWGRVFHNRLIVSEPAMQLIVEAGGIE